MLPPAPRSAPPTAAPPPAPLRVSVVINTYNRASSLVSTLESLPRQNYPHFEVIVVNGPSSDGTAALLEAHSSWIRVGRCSERNLSISRNLGIQMACGDLVAFIDDDAVPDEDWLRDACAAFDSPEVGGVGGFVYDHTGYTLQYGYTVCDRLGNAYHSLPCSMPEFCYPGCLRYPALLGTNSVFRRSALLEIGGFDEQFDYFLDETDVNLRLVDAGYLLKQIPRAFVYHRYLPSHIRNQARANTNYLPILQNRIYFGLKNAPSEPGYAATLMKDWAELSGGAQNSVEYGIRQGNLDPRLREIFRQDLDRAFREGIERGFHRPRRLLGTEAAQQWRGTIELDALDAAHAGTFKACPLRLSAAEKLTICLLSQQYPPRVVGGIGRLTRDLAGGLAERGHNVHVLTRASQDLNTVDFEHGVWVHRLVEDQPEPQPPAGLALPAHLWRHSARMLRELRRIRQTRPVDIVEAPIWDVEGLATLLDGSFRVVTSLHTPLRKVVENNPDWQENMTPEKAAAYEQLAQAEVLVAGRCQGLRANSRAVVETMRRYYGLELPAEKLFLVPHGMEDRCGGQPLGPPAGNFVDVLYAGRFEGRKGTDVLLAALPALCEKHPRARFILVGEDRARPGGSTLAQEFRARHRRAGFLHRVVFAGEVPDQTLEAYLRQCHIFVAPSRYESFGLVFLEAMMFGKPAVGCRAGGMPEVIEEGVTGLLAEPGDAASLAAALDALLSDPARREALGRAARERYLAHYTREKLTERTLELYRQVLHAAPAPAEGPSCAAPAELLELARS